MVAERLIRLTVATQAEVRIDRYVAEVAHDEEVSSRISRSQFQKLISEGKVLRNDKVVKRSSELVRTGDQIELRLDHAENNSTTHATPFELSIVFEDEHLIVLNKPHGIAMHPGAGSHAVTVAGALIHHVGKCLQSVGSPGRSGIVHRLDKDTTGIVVAAKSTPVHAFLSAQFERRSVGRIYSALVFTTPRASRLVRKQDEGEVETLIGRDEKNRKKMAVLESGGRRAKSHWSVVERMSYGSLLDVRLATGRTHQIRVHMEHIGSPIIGDTVYGDFSGLPDRLAAAANKFGRQALHARYLAFDHPNGQRMEFSADVPEDFGELISTFRAYNY